MRSKAIAGALLGLAMTLGQAGCLPPAVDPVGPERGALGISVTNRWASMGFFAGKPEWVHFVRWNDKEETVAQTEVFTTNFSRDNRAYLLNARPGRYAVVATTELTRREEKPDNRRAVAGREGESWLRRAEAPGKGPRYVPVSFRGAKALRIGKAESGEKRTLTTYLSDEMIRRTMVEVAPGGFTFAGRLAVTRDLKISLGDRAVNHFHPLRNQTLLDYLGVIVVPSEESASRGTGLKIER